MTCYTITRSTTVTSATEVEREHHELGQAYADVWHDRARGCWESTAFTTFATRAEAVAATVADLRRKASDMLALASAMEGEG